MATTIYWHDIEDSLGHWEGLDVTVASSSTRRPPLHLLTGNNGRMKLMLNDLPLFWATSEHGYDGAWVVRNCLSASMDMSVIPMIRSAEVERYASLAPVERIKAWSRFFVSRLSESASSFLCPGHWLAQGMLPDIGNSVAGPMGGISSWRFSPAEGPGSRLPDWWISAQDIFNCNLSKHVCWIDWGGRPEKFISLRDVDPFSGRLKWWRKKARDGSLPPILVWYVAGLASHVIIDGHHRLLAAIDENIAPSFIVLSSINSEPSITRHSEDKQRIVDSLLNQRARHPGFSTDALNGQLIRIFDDRPFLRPSTHSWAGISSEEEWVAEVTEYLSTQGGDEYLQRILERSE